MKHIIKKANFYIDGVFIGEATNIEIIINTPENEKDNMIMSSHSENLMFSLNNTLEAD